MASEVREVRDGDNRYRVLIDGVTAGFVEKWYLTDKVNQTGLPRFRAVQVGGGVRSDCESLASARAFIVAGWQA